MKDLVLSAQNLLNIRLTGSQINALQIYEQELLAWNAHTNLTAIRSAEQIRIKHFLDSLTCMLAMRDTPINQVIDIGTGAGFPGLPLKIINPDMRLTLVESVGKKVDFCQHIVSVLHLEGVEIIKARAEEVGRMPDHRQKYDWAVARAVAVLPVLAEYLLPLVKIGGGMLAMKGESAPAETTTAEHAIRLLGGRLQKLLSIALPGVVEERYLIIIDKIAATADIYPRRVGVPTKHPLLK
ncbi:MAG: 16S rRNA (guanine(527)-N(7))-methyltransferase RsmG [Anaerolineales bacterium]|nr:16S rRNA (guanine(527)-N(7))-methyltransferase RsmG [Anaerolineales bacterium]